MPTQSKRERNQHLIVESQGLAAELIKTDYLDLFRIIEAGDLEGHITKGKLKGMKIGQLSKTQLQKFIESCPCKESRSVVASVLAGRLS